MDRSVPIRERCEGRLHLVHLDPKRYTPTERMYIAARVTRTFDHPDKIVSRFYEDLGRAGVDGWFTHPRDAMGNWLREKIVNDRHDSVLEFAGLEYAVWVSGVSLGTIRDIDRHRLYSYEEYTTRALGESLKARKPHLEQAYFWLRHPFPEEEPNWEALEDLFYIHPGFRTRRGEDAVRLRLAHQSQALLEYLNEVEIHLGWSDAEDANRDVLPLGLRTPFILAPSNQRVAGEAHAKRTCARVGHREYVDFYRLLTELLAPVCPFLTDIIGRWCPAQETPERCCRTRWLEGLQ